ncbi:hypothetical protein [Bradyrhizobium elkanii]|uniref:hypothetical protein n=1 Tax=Bradyrhizobium elkanii TaxID=29448 RepID=UPI003519A271
MTRVLSHVYRLFLASPMPLLAIVGLNWRYGDRVIAWFTNIGRAHQVLLGSIGTICVTLLIIAILHDVGLIDRAWPDRKAPKIRKVVVGVLDKYTNRVRGRR